MNCDFLEQSRIVTSFRQHCIFMFLVGCWLFVTIRPGYATNKKTTPPSNSAKSRPYKAMKVVLLGKRKQRLAPYQPCRIWAQIDNDAFVFVTDRGYTQGLEIHTKGCFGGEFAHTITKWLFGSEIKYMTSAIGVQWLGQHIYTPENVFASNLILDDRPYAGWLHAGLSYHVQNEHSRFAFQLQIGLTGPPSGAEFIQNQWHRFLFQFDGYTPDVQGWNNQIPLEVQVQTSFLWDLEIFAFERTNGSVVRLKNVDMYLNTKAELGMAMVRFMVGSTFRIGQIIQQIQSVSNDGIAQYKHGKAIVQQETRANQAYYAPFELYGVFAVRAHFVFHNMFVSGSLWTQSHGVPIQNVVFESEIGLVMRFGSFRFRFGGVLRGREGHYENAPLGGHRFIRIQVGYES